MSTAGSLWHITVSCFFSIILGFTQANVSGSSAIIGKLWAPCLILSVNHRHDKRPRYTNSLLMSLNNRIYFRDRYASSTAGDSIQLTVTSRMCTTGQATGTASIDFPSAETRLRSPIRVVELKSSHTRDLENGKGDCASINYDT